jgi:hypothetical protein
MSGWRIGAAPGPDQVSALAATVDAITVARDIFLVQRVFVPRRACRATIMDRGAAIGTRVGIARARKGMKELGRAPLASVAD